MSQAPEILIPPLVNNHNDGTKYANNLASSQIKLKKNLKIQEDGQKMQSQLDHSHASQILSSQFQNYNNTASIIQSSRPNNKTEKEKNLSTQTIQKIEDDSVLQKKAQNEKDEVIQITKKKGIFEEYQERWEKNNKKIFRYLITWKVGDNGKIEDQLKLMITYLSIIFAVVLIACGFGTTYYFHMTNKENIRNSIENQAQTILMNGLSQYYNSTEYIFKGYEFVLNYLNDIVLSKLEISYKVYNFNEIRQFPYKGPNKMHLKDDSDTSKCPIFTGDVVFDNGASLKCIDWYEFNKKTLPTVHNDVYQIDIPQDKLNGSIDILNYILESQMFDVFVTKMYRIYFGFETRQAMYVYPGLVLTGVPSTFVMHNRSWYNKTKYYHLNQKDEQTFRVFSTPYYDAASNARVVTISKAVLAPNESDQTKRYLTGKGRFMGVSNIDIQLKQFQKLFDDILFYQTGYLAIVSHEGKLLNEPAQFISQIEMEGKIFQDLNITQLISAESWEQIKGSQEKQIMIVTTLFGLDIVIASCLNSENFYEGESVVIMFIIPKDEVYGAIDTQNASNLNRILLSSLVSLGGFLIGTFICTIYVKKKIVCMVSAITQLNQSALKLSSQSAGDTSTSSKKEVMQQLHEIQEKAESQTIKELVKGFENQLKGISKLGKGGQNILKNGKNQLKFESGQLCGTHLQQYVNPLLDFIESKRQIIETDLTSSICQMSSSQHNTAISNLNVKTILSKNQNDKEDPNNQTKNILNEFKHDAKNSLCLIEKINNEFQMDLSFQNAKDKSVNNQIKKSNKPFKDVDVLNSPLPFMNNNISQERNLTRIEQEQAPMINRNEYQRDICLDSNMSFSDLPESQGISNEKEENSINQAKIFQMNQNIFQMDSPLIKKKNYDNLDSYKQENTQQ